MCGFTGFTNRIGDDGTVLEKMMNRIVHRGPDSAGKYIDSDIALGFRRLSIYRYHPHSKSRCQDYSILWFQ